MVTLDLWSRILSTTRRATEAGVLEPITTDRVVVEECGIPFVVHILARLDRKVRARERQKETGENPFLPPDPRLTVAVVSDTHLCVLNRFNVIDHHLLIITRRFADQDELLDLEDFEALARCMAEVDGLGFYNAGTVAGASQPHKHLQLIPLPLGSGPAPTPMDEIIGRIDASHDVVRIPSLPFVHAIVQLPDREFSISDTRTLYDVYFRLLDAVGIHDAGRPYNLLVTRRWMLAVPRHSEFNEGISINALGFAGSLLVRDQEQLAVVRSRGPLSVLAAVVG
jgi:ATP adenylyltransferase